MNSYTQPMDATVLHPEWQEPEVARITLRRDQLSKFRRIASRHLPPPESLEIDAQFAKRIGINAGQVSRVLHGSAPGTRFIAGCLELFGIECFADLFAVEPDDEGEAA